jgi:hypothetical protein
MRMLCGRNSRMKMSCSRVEFTLLVLSLTLVASANATDRAAVGVFRDWGAFREGPSGLPTRCFAIAEPPRGTATSGHGAFASVASWPAERVRGQVAIRLSHPLRDRAAVTLTIGDAAFPMIARGQDAWAHNRHQDARIVSAMRAGSSMSISSVGAGGDPFADVYRLRGAASAIDAAALACPMRPGSAAGG